MGRKEFKTLMTWWKKLHTEYMEKLESENDLEEKPEDEIEIEEIAKSGSEDELEKIDQQILELEVCK